MVGLVSMELALIGIIFWNNKLKMLRIKYYFTLIGLFLGLFYGLDKENMKLSNGFWKFMWNGNFY